MEHAVDDGDVFETAVRFGPELDAAGAVYFCIRGKALVSRVEQGAFLEAAGDHAIADGHHFGRGGVAEGERTFQADGVVPGRIDAAIGDANVAAAVNVHAVAVGVDLQVVDCKVVHAGGEDAEVASVKNGKIAQQHVAAIFQRDGLVAHARILGAWPRAPSATQAFAPNQSRAGDGDVLKALTPDQAVVPMIVAEILKALPGRV